MRRTLGFFMIAWMFCASAYAAGTDQFPFRAFDDIKRPRTAHEVRVSYRSLVSTRDGVDKLEAKLIALYALVEDRRELGYDLYKPQVFDQGTQWQVRIPSKFSINQQKRPSDFVVCVDKTRGRMTCFGPDNQGPGQVR